MPRGDAVHGVGVIGDLDRPARQLLPESYRAGSAAQNRFRQHRDPCGELLRGPEPRPPEPFAVVRVDRRRDLAPLGIEHGEAPSVAGEHAQTPAKRIEGADAAQRQPPTEGQRPSRGDADPQTGERAGADPDRDPLHRRPAAYRIDRPLDLGQKRGRVLRPALLGEAEQRLVDDLAVAYRGDGGVARRRIEADRYQRAATSEP
jgi:hypothetical protein